MSSPSQPEDHIPTADHVLEAGLSCLVLIGDQSHVVELPASGEIIVGRGSEALLRVVADGVSRKHAHLRVEPDAVLVTDLGSRNGTHVNGTRISEPRRAGHGDEIRVGEARLVISTRPVASVGAPLLMQGALLGRLRIEVARAAAFGRPFTLLAAHADGSLRESGVAATTARALRPADLACLLDDRTLVLALVDQSIDDARRFDSALRADAASRGVACTTTLVAFEKGMTADDLLQRVTTSSGETAAASTRGVVEPPVVADPAMRAIYEQIARVSRSNVAVLVLGETGVGKELVANAIHRASGRQGKLVSVNAAALPEALLESELFGHERGAFTGASAAKPGLFETAHGGTLFLDEVGELTLATQAKLLRVIENGLVRRVGSTTEKQVDVRIVAATNVDLQAACAARSFRQDLLFRLNACTLVVPPLRARPLEVRALAEHFLAKAARGRPIRLADEALDALTRYEWPGNVRELRNVVERALLLCDAADRSIELRHLPEALQASPSARSRAPALDATRGVRESVESYERERIVSAMNASGGNLTHAAELLKLPRKTLAYRLEKLGLRGKD